MTKMHQMSMMLIISSVSIVVAGPTYLDDYMDQFMNKWIKSP